MSTRIPPSLAWLIKKRARLNGKIQKASKAIERMHKLETDYAHWQADLAAIDRALAMHEIQVDVECIPSVAPMEKRILAHGELSRALLKFLRESDGEPLSTNTLTMMLIDHCAALKESTPDSIALELTFKRFRSSVHNRLKNLAREKEIVRSPCAHGSRATHWILPTDLLDS